MQQRVWLKWSCFQDMEAYLVYHAYKIEVSANFTVFLRVVLWGCHILIQVILTHWLFLFFNLIFFFFFCFLGPCLWHMETPRLGVELEFQQELLMEFFKTSDEGVLIVVQWKWIRLVSMRIWVWSLASLNGLRILHCHELWCRSKMQLGSVA